MSFKRYKLQSDGATLLSKLIDIKTVTSAAARQLMVRLLEARFGDVAQIGATLEAVSTLKHDAPDEEIDSLRNFLHQRLREDVRWQTDGGMFAGQGVSIEQVQINRSEDALEIAFHGSLAELLAVQLFLLTRFVSRGQIRECECGRLFVKFGKGETCSTRCTKRIDQRIRRRDPSYSAKQGKKNDRSHLRTQVHRAARRQRKTKVG